MKFTITYIRTLTLEEAIDVSSAEDAERHAKARAWESCELANNDFAESHTEFEVSQQDIEESAWQEAIEPVETPRWIKAWQHCFRGDLPSEDEEP
jgi:hypothetical protein